MRQDLPDACRPYSAIYVDSQGYSKISCERSNDVKAMSMHKCIKNDKLHLTVVGWCAALNVYTLISMQEQVQELSPK